ncbi:MAG: CNNM domain-containing protein, partial [archaeon]|nr:CNNM domain-containing protein [archaeon]
MPQSICTRYGLAIGGNLFWLVWTLMIVFAPVALPISWLLDWLLGKEHSTFYRRNELKELIQQHKRHLDDDECVGIEKFLITRPAASISDSPYQPTFHSTRSNRPSALLSKQPSDSKSEMTPLLSPRASTNGSEAPGSQRKDRRKSKQQAHDDAHESEKLTRAEVDIIKGALELKEKSVEDVMTPFNKVVTLSIRTLLDKSNLERIKATGFSRIPVYNGTNKSDVIGTLIAKELIGIDPSAKIPLHQLPLHPLPLILGSTHLHEMLTFFVTGDSHIAIVVRSIDDLTPLGLISFEDVIEALIGVEIVDETDNLNYMSLRSPSSLLVGVPTGLRSPSFAGFARNPFETPVIHPRAAREALTGGDMHSSSFKKVVSFAHHGQHLNTVSTSDIRESLMNPSLIRLSAAVLSTPLSSSHQTPSSS